MSRAPPDAGDDAGYVMSHFTTESEALHLAFSEDGYDWHMLADGEGVLESDVGSGSIHDPFCYADGERYHLFGTDSWHSHSLVHATSPDLRTWSDPELVPVMVDIPETLNVWAPECYYDHEAGVHDSSGPLPSAPPPSSAHSIASWTTPSIASARPTRGRGRSRHSPSR